ncbi:MAG: ferrous iron transport protein B, partial [Candidatus Aminicenantes bacterium]|nr:ferrous iron transport protein B [Candidatus Aminicenantes bacterium]
MSSKPRPPTVVLVGQPNCGKSTLFNAIAGPKAEVSNFPGTSTKHTHSEVRVGERTLTVVDLPGTYSLVPLDPAEKVAYGHLFQEKPDLVLNVVDASTLSRSLELTLELLEMRRPMIVVLNMVDLAEKKGFQIDTDRLAELLGVPVVATIASHGRGIKELLDLSCEVIDRGQSIPRHAWSADVQAKLDDLAGLLPPDLCEDADAVFAAAKLIETGNLACDGLLGDIEPSFKAELDRVRAELEAMRGVPAYEVISAERHHLALKISEEAGRLSHGPRLTWDKKVDDVLMHPVFGYIFMTAIFLLFFIVIFKVGNPLETLLLEPLAEMRLWLAARLGSGLVYHLAEGLLQGVGGGVAIVLPYFIPLLLLMAVLEDVGYLARAGFLLDTFMHRIGLHGKSISPFILGFGCNVPAVVATRILESRRDRIITSLLIPFIPCSARTTIILALVAFYLGPFYALGFYIVNLAVVAVLGWVLSRLVKAESPGLILEIPSLKIPSLGTVANKVRLQLMDFIKLAWPLLIAGSLVLSL